jgi:hypothetical protein
MGIARQNVPILPSCRPIKIQSSAVQISPVTSPNDEFLVDVGCSDRRSREPRESRRRIAVEESRTGKGGGFDGPYVRGAGKDGMSGEEDATLNEPTNSWLQPKIGRGCNTVRYDRLAEAGSSRAFVDPVRTRFTLVRCRGAG